MTASALNIASIAPAAQPGAGASANAAGAGPLAGFEAVLDALFAQADPTAAIAAAASAGQTATSAIPGAPVKGDALPGGANDDTDPDADAAVETPATDGTATSDAEAGLAVCLMAAQPAIVDTPVIASKDATAGGPPIFGADTPKSPAVAPIRRDAAAAGKAELAAQATDTATPAVDTEAPDTPAAPPQAAQPAPQARSTAPAPTPAPAAQAPATPPPAAAMPDVQPEVALAAAVETPVETPAADTTAVAASLTARPDAVPAQAGRPAKTERAKAATDASATAPDGPAPANAADKPAQAKPAQGAAQGAAKNSSNPVEAAEAKPEDAKVEPESFDATLPAETRSASQAGPTSHSTHGVRGGSETVANLAAQMVKKLGEKTSRFDVQLDPHGLGKVDVRIEIGATGRITAGMTFDNPQAAADVKARAADLQRALEQAGFDVSGGISFDVAQDRGQQQQNQAWQDQGDTGRAFQGRAFRAALETAGDAAEAANQGALRLRRGVNSGLDLRI